MASIKDVAKRAGVGVATVSRVLNDNGYVSEETRKKIEKSMDELSYTPNELARQLYRKKAGIVAVLMPDISHPFFSELVKHIESILYEYGYKTMLCDTFKEKNSEQEYIDMLDKHIVDGIITGVHSLAVEAYTKIKKPIVAFDRYLGSNIPVIGADHYMGGRMAADILMKSGCRHVIQFEGAKIVNSPSHERHIEFARVLVENGIEVVSKELEWNQFDSSYFEKVTEEILKQHPETDGVFGADLLAIYCMKVARAKKKRVPEDICFVAYDGTFVTKLTDPVMTAIVQPIPKIAERLVKTICDLIDGKTIKDYRQKFDVSIRMGETSR